MLRAMRMVVALSIAACTLAAPGIARGNGGNSHTWISLHAIEHLPDGKLRELLTRPELQTMIVNGSVFPDGGYVVDDDYGEMSHWEPFIEAYVRWMRDHFDVPLNTGKAAEHTAFLMGVASHGMADQVFDATFMDAARIHDAANWSETLLEDFDTATDVMLVADTGVNYLDHLPWVPADDISALYRDAFGYDVSPGVLDSTQELLHRFVLNFAVSSAMEPQTVQDFRDQYPWASEHLMEEVSVGAPPCEGKVVADYMLALWDRLHDESGMQNYVIATHPRDGDPGHPTDYTAVESQVVVVFGSGIERDQLDGKFEIRDSTGRSYEFTAGTQWGTEVGNLVKLKPLQDWAEDEVFTVTLAPGLVTNDGLTLEEPWSFTFSTAAAAEPVLPTSDPTPHVGEPDVGELPDAGCCGVGGGGGGGAAGLALLVLAMLRRPRRARS